MRKLFIIAIFLMMFGTIIASESRIDALGKNSLFLLDNNDVYRNPAYLYDYTNLAIGELGTYNGMYATNAWVGTNLKVNNTLSFGLAAQRVCGEINSLSPSELALKPINGLDFLANYKMEKMSFGLGIYKSGNKETSKSVNTSGTVTGESENSVGVFGVRLGMLMLPDEKSNIDASISLNFNGMKDKETVGNNSVTDELTGGMGLGFAVRAFMPFKENLKFVPSASFNTFSYKMKHSDTANSNLNAESGSVSDMELNVGAGLNWNIDDALIIAGLVFQLEKNTDEFDTSRTITTTDMHFPQLILGVEKPFGNHFTGRFGVQKNFGTYKSKTEHTNGSSSESSDSRGESDEIITMGMTVKFDKLALDASLDTKSIFNGSFIVSGISRYMNSKLSISYAF